MNSFIFQNPTKLIFGKDTISKLTNEIPLDKKIMVTFGRSSVKHNGVYDQVKEALKAHNYIEFWGIEPNPTVETLRQAIKLGKENHIDFLLAIGGGSVIDGTKLISVGIPYEGDAWDILIEASSANNRTPKILDRIKAIPFASVLTIPATGSEMNRGAVISNRTTKEKLSFYSNYPVFSILDPSTTFSLPNFQIACGMADTFAHILEQYLTVTTNSPIMDRWCEGLLKTLTEIAPFVQKEPRDYDIMSTFMLTATLALNGFIAMGSTTDWCTHMIGHEVTALTGLTHGQTLSIIFPATISVLREQKKLKILQYAHRVFGINQKDDSAIDMAISATESFFRSLGLATKLSELEVDKSIIDEIEKRFTERNLQIGENHNVNGTIAKKILLNCF